MSYVSDTLTKVLRKMRNCPEVGMEYNLLNPNRWVSRKLLDVDIARNPNVISNKFIRIDVLAKVHHINGERSRIVSKIRFIKGRIT